MIATVAAYQYWRITHPEAAEISWPAAWAVVFSSLLLGIFFKMVWEDVKRAWRDWL